MKNKTNYESNKREILQDDSASESNLQVCDKLPVD